MADLDPVYWGILDVADMTAEQHHTEARRLLAIARESIVTGAPIGFDTHLEVAQLAQVHATLALYRPPPLMEEVDYDHA